MFIKNSSSRVKVFISYSHKDKRRLERLRVHLIPMERVALIELWDDTRIDPGGKWKEEIRIAIESAVTVILLISAEFLASEFIITDELPRILKASEKREVILSRRCRRYINPD